MLSISGISKAYPGVRSLRGVDLEVGAGEVHAILGENGAGKSTLVRAIAGAVRADEGVIRFDGLDRRWHSPKDAVAAGLHVIYQEFALFPKHSVAANIFAGRELKTPMRTLDHRKMHSSARRVLEDLGVDIDTEQLTGSLSIADQQMVEIARALVHEVKLLILDEPTAVLGERESQLLLRQVLRLKNLGVAILYVSHRLNEVKEVCDSAAILKDGSLVARIDVGQTSVDRMIALMVGRDIKDVFPPRAPTHAGDDDSCAARLKGGSAATLRDVDITVRRGEIVGVGGLPGSGALELAYVLAGAAPLRSGTIEIGGMLQSSYDVTTAFAHGVGFVNEDRKGKGLLAALDLAANIVAPDSRAVASNGVVSSAKEKAIADEAVAAFRIACPSIDADVFSLSGGNQQKVLLARWARIARQLLILAEPTRGVDVGARAEIYRLLAKVAAQGTAIVIVSSDLPELLGLSSRILVFREGRVAGELDAATASEEAFMHLASIH